MKKAKLFMMLALLVMGVSNVFAQNVTVRPDNGSLLCNKKTGGGDTFFNWGGFSTWKHEQLSLTMTTGDSDNNLNQGNNGILNPLTSSGQLQNPANDIFVSSKESNGKSYFQIGKGGVRGTGLDTYLTISLPKGYRFTGYTIKFHRISEPNGASDEVNNYNGNISFGETNNSFTYRSTNNNSGTYRGDIGQSNTTQYTLSRTSQTDADMDNLLYFKLSNNRALGRAFIQLDHVELFFTAEADYTPLIPSPNVDGESAVDISFLTSKLDYGTLSPQTDGGDARLGYGGTVYELNGKLTLYEDGSVTADKDNGFDGTVGKMVDYKSGSISTEGDYFKLESTSHGKLKGDTAIYYLEAPIWATTSDAASAHKHPIGYRIVGASFDYAGVKTSYIPAIFQIRFYDEDEEWYYALNYQSSQYNGNEDYQTPWRIDEDGYIYYGSYYISVNRNGDFQITTSKPTADRGTFEIVDNNGVKQIRRKNYPTQYIGWEKSNAWTWGGVQVRRNAIITTSENNRASYYELSAASGGNVTPYTFVIYDKTGTKVAKKVVVNSAIDDVLSIDSLNNDAVKIGVIGTGYIKGHVILQALDPYIDRLDIVCQEQGGNGGKLTQQFNSTDFSVRGGKFTFYVPEDFRAPALFTFDNLYSHWGDDTYYGETNSTNHARYYFVGSTYAGYENNDVYARYNNASHRNADYTTKISCLKPGNIAFTFNNAATIADGEVFKEYPFSVAKYQQEGGNFNTDFIFEQEEMGATPAVEKTAYLFTSDETRYNIAPTTGTQHVYYAYYEMTIEMERKDYRPIFEWKKIYDETFYSANNSDIVRDPQWGLEITTQKVTDDQGTHSGYLTVSKILDVIQNGLPATAAQGTTPAQPAVQGLDTTGENAPKSMNQILYIDGSNLMSIMANQTVRLDEHGDTVKVDGKPQYDSHPVSELLKKLGTVINGDTITNALIYLPYGSKSSDDNFAYNTIAQYAETPIFRGANNIVINDRYPFYAPYDIQVDAAKMAKYERTLTNQDLYGDDDQHLTIVLPFEINVDGEGVHTNNDSEQEGGSPFTLATMNSSNSLSKNPDAQIDYYANGYFTKITEKSEPNKPYVVTMQGTAGESAFKVHVNGSLVKATPDTTGILAGETASGTYTYKEDDVNKTDEYNFTHKGTYTGIEIGDEKNGGAAAAETKVFYFANNYFLDSKTLINGKSLKMLPFRSYYQYAGPANAKMSRFRIVFGENPYANETTGINEVQRDADLAVIPGDGCITLMARAQKNVTIHAVSGITVDKCSLNAGETRTVSVPAGVYVINGVKMVVK